MIKIRSALILLVVLSIAMLPASVGMMVSAPGAVQSGSTVVSMSNAGDQGGMTDETMNDCQASAGCAWKCFGLCNLSFEPKFNHPPLGEIKFSLPHKLVYSQPTSPPFRPPRA